MEFLIPIALIWIMFSWFGKKRQVRRRQRQLAADEAARIERRRQHEIKKRSQILDDLLRSVQFRQESSIFIEHLARTHIKVLYKKKMQKTRQDDYGNVFDSGWITEKRYFYREVILPKLKANFSDYQYRSYDDSPTSEIIEALTTSYAETDQSRDFDIDSLTPYEFEAYCAELLKQGGWTAWATSGSGDQGIDVMAEKDGYSAVFQVKKYSSPVGNKAVQEVIAGRAFVAADLAYVVSNSSYTPSAVALANASGVKLLHFSELSILDTPS